MSEFGDKCRHAAKRAKNQLRDRYGRFGRFMAKTAPARKRVNANAWPWFWWALLAIVVIWYIAPHQLGVLLWNVCKLCVGAWVGYRIDHNIFDDARPEEMRIPLEQKEAIHAHYRRMAAVCVGMLTMGVSA